MDKNASSAAALASAMAGTFVFIAVTMLAVTAFCVWVFWRIFAKAGYNGALGLLCLIPSVGPLVCLLILAFGTWPNEQQPVAYPAMPPSAV
ncbi:MAG: hypothetical protein M3N13_03525 [Candidatus Eremiobacteraeota bacterium]|nr:hypothetical protein [Candidatus Eremiobacteraeota bacterium]